jgi:hypothetical protein
MDLSHKQTFKNKRTIELNRLLTLPCSLPLKESQPHIRDVVPLVVMLRKRLGS